MVLEQTGDGALQESPGKVAAMEANTALIVCSGLASVDQWLVVATWSEACEVH